MKFKKYETNYKYGKFLKEKEINGFEESFDNMENNVIIVYPEIQYQEIMGFGGALTESSGYVFSRFSEEVKNNFIKGIIYFLSLSIEKSFKYSSLEYA